MRLTHLIGPVGCATRQKRGFTYSQHKKTRERDRGFFLVARAELMLRDGGSA